MDKASTTYLILDLTFYAIDEDGNELKNSKGELRTFVPKEGWKELEYLTEDRNEDSFEEINDDKVR